MIWPLVLIVTGLWVVGSASMFLWHVHLGRQVAAVTKKFERTGSGITRILLAGDSVVFGVGASMPSASIAGLFGRDFPNASIINSGVSGAETDGLVQQLQKVQGQRFDLLVIIIGANDVVHLSDLKASLHNLDQALAIASSLSDHVVLMPEGNMGNPPLFPRLASLIFTPRSRQFRNGAMQIADKYHSVYVDVFRERSADSWRKDIGRFYAADYFHPADAGYLDWYQAIRTVTPILNF